MASLVELVGAHLSHRDTPVPVKALLLSLLLLLLQEYCG